MDKGNWVAIDKNCVAWLPTRRRFTKVEALVSLQCDLDNKKILRPVDYARIWKWDISETSKFLKSLRVTTESPIKNSTASVRIINGLGNAESAEKSRKNTTGSPAHTMNLLNPKEPKQEKKAITIDPEGFTPSAEDIAYGRKNGLDVLEIQYQTERFISYAKERAQNTPKKAYKNLSSAFQKWLTSQYFKPMPSHVRAARQAEQLKKRDEVKYDIKPVQEVGPEMQLPKFPFEA